MCSEKVEKSHYLPVSQLIFLRLLFGVKQAGILVIMCVRAELWRSCDIKEASVQICFITVQKFGLVFCTFTPQSRF